MHSYSSLSLFHSPPKQDFIGPGSCCFVQCTEQQQQQLWWLIDRLPIICLVMYLGHTRHIVNELQLATGTSVISLPRVVKSSRILASMFKVPQQNVGEPWKASLLAARENLTPSMGVWVAVGFWELEPQKGMHTSSEVSYVIES